MNATTMRGLRASTLLLRPTPKCHHFPQLRPQTLSHFARHVSTTTTPPSLTYKTSPLNPPSTTMPAPLIIPSREPTQSLFSYAFKSGKTYITFYKTGLKNIFTNQRLARAVLARTNKHKSIRAAVRAGELNRGEHILIWRAWHDIIRVPLFALVVLVCGEFTPLVVVFISGVVPWTCRIPRQVEKDRKKMEERRAKAFREIGATPPSEKGVGKLGHEQLLQIAASLGLTGKVVEVLGSPTRYLRWKVERWVRYLELDDELIRRGGGLKDMDGEEVKMALTERGVDVRGRDDMALKRDLYSWLHSREVAPVEKLLLMRPNVWPAQAPELPK